MNSINSIQKLSILAAFALTTIACGTADIRPESLKNGEPSANSVAKGRAILERVFAASGGLDNWKKYASVRAKFRDDWSTAPAPAKWLFMEYEEHNLPIQLDAVLGTFGNSRMTFLDGPEKGDVWGVVDAERFYTIDAGKKTPVFAEHGGRQLFLQNAEFFISFPFYLESADQVTHLEEVDFEGKPHDLIFLSWKTFAPQPDIDQWQIWVDQATGLITQIKFTVRDTAPFIEGVYYFREYRKVGEFTMPRKADARFSEDDAAAVHTYDFYEIEFLTEARTAEIIPQ
ncbi:MAG: hypothetical protein NXI24_01930 [bacterium]|nr:hypothetical protein [bacterium]